MRVIVVGAGIVGLSIAGRLAERGADVTVLEADHPGGGLTSTTYGWLNAGFLPVGHAYWSLRARSVALWHAAHAGATWLHPGGSLHVERTGDDERRLLAWVETLRGWGEPVRELGPEELRSLEPDLAPVTGRPLLFERDAWVDTAGAVGHLVDRLVQLSGPGALRTGTSIVGLTPAPRAPGVRLASGEVVHADHVVVAAGRSTPTLTGADLVPLRSGDDRGVPGLLVLTHPGPVGVRRIVRSHDLVMRPAPGGGLLLQAGGLDADLRLDEPASVTDRRVRELLERAGALLAGAGAGGAGHPALAAAQVTVAARALPADGLPIVGWLDGSRRTYVAVSHSGVVLAPVLAEIAGTELLDGRRDAALAAYLPRPA